MSISEEDVKKNNIRSADTNPAVHISTGKRTVLAVEDNELNLELLTAILSTEYNVIQAENGKIGLELLQKNLSEIAVVVLDVQMPVMNGYEFLAAVQNDSLLSEIPVVVATGNNNIEEEQKCLDLGAVDFVAKPYNAGIILSRIASIIRLKESVATISVLQLDDRTGLYTLRAFYHYAGQLLDSNPAGQFSVVVIDVNRYKILSDLYGEEGGSGILKNIAGALHDYTAASDIYGRFGNAKFLLIKELADSSDTDEWLEHLFASMKEASGVKNISFRAGICDITDSTVTIETACEHAVTALNSISDESSDGHSRYDRRLELRANRIAKLEFDMHRAYENDEFSVYYQPKHSAATGELTGAEALIRWNHPELGFLSPGEFIPLFEHNGFITQADSYVWEHTCRNLRKWIDEGISVVPVSVNASKRDFINENLAESCMKSVNESGISSELLHIEVTESLFSDRLEEISKILEKCRETGIKIELDDFGTGYSSLTSLTALPLDYIKLDMSFMKNIKDKKRQNVVNACIKLAKSLGLQTVCEGVETEEQLALLKQFGCEHIQGYYFSKPLPEAEFREYLINYTEKVDK